MSFYNNETFLHWILSEKMDEAWKTCKKTWNMAAILLAIVDTSICALDYEAVLSIP